MERNKRARPVNPRHLGIILIVSDGAGQPALFAQPNWSEPVHIHDDSSDHFPFLDSSI